MPAPQEFYHSTLYLIRSESAVIEILWRFIKYEWISIDTYKDWKTFVRSVEKILREFEENYVINFV
jgi:hypothetical protein